MKDYYQILEIDPNASQENIKEQYRFLVQAWHPDKFSNPNQKVKAEEKLKDINDAYEFLSNPAKRTSYDETYFEQRQRHKSQRRDEELQDIDENIDNLKNEVGELNKKTPKIPSWWTYSIFVLIFVGYAKSAISLSMKEGDYILQAAIGVVVIILGLIFTYFGNNFHKTKRKANLDLVEQHNQKIKELSQERKQILRRSKSQSV